MKTPREVLFEQHQAAEPKLVSIREKVVAGLAPDAPVRATRTPPAVSRGASVLEAGWRQFLWSLRWHVVGLSAAWVVVLVLSIDDAPRVAQTGANKKEMVSPLQSLAALRESHRQLRELLEAPPKEPVPEPPKPTPTPQSQLRPLSTAAA